MYIKIGGNGTIAVLGIVAHIQFFEHISIKVLFFAVYSYLWVLCVFPTNLSEDVTILMNKATVLVYF